MGTLKKDEGLGLVSFQTFFSTFMILAELIVTCKYFIYEFVYCLSTLTFPTHYSNPPQMVSSLEAGTWKLVHLLVPRVVSGTCIELALMEQCPMSDVSNACLGLT